jgi:hypothetical protein
MIRRVTGPQCLSSRVSALADGSLPDDVRDRALAHVTSCPDCRADLEAERLLRARLQVLSQPQPSAALMASLLAMGEPGGPMPPRPGHVPGMPRPAAAVIRRDPVTPGRRSTSRSPELPARPGPTSRPGRRAAGRRRTVVGVTAGAFGVGVIAAALASGLPATPRVGPEQPRVQANMQANVQANEQANLQVSATQASAPSFVAPGLSSGGVGSVVGIEAVLAVPADSAGAGPVTSRPGDARSGAAALPAVTTTLLHHLLSMAGPAR